MISPAEAANVQMAKYGALAAGATAISDVAAGVAEIQANEELSSATAQFQASIGSIDTALAQKPYETDEKGRLVSDSKNIVNEERAARMQLAGDIRANIKSGAARKAFDQWMTETGAQRDSAYQAKMIERESAVITARLNVDVNNMLDAGEYDSARQRIDDGVSNGAMSPLQYIKAQREIDTREVTDQIYTVLNAPLDEINPDDVDTLLTKMESDEFDLLTGAQKYSYINQLNNKLSNLGGDIEAAEAEQQRQIYHALLVKGSKGELSLPMLLNSGLTDKTYFKDILTQTRQEDGGSTSDAAVKRAFEVSMQQLMMTGYDGDWGQRVTQLKDSILTPGNGLTFDDSTKMATKLDSLESGIFSTPLYQNLSRQAFENIVGFDEGLLGEVTAGLQAQYKVTADVGREFQQALMRKAEALGPSRQDELDKWVESAKNGYRLLAGRKNLEKVGVNVTIPEDGILTEELRLDISKQLQTWYTKTADGAEADIQSIDAQINSVIKEVERLYQWKLDEPQ